MVWSGVLPLHGSDVAWCSEGWAGGGLTAKHGRLCLLAGRVECRGGACTATCSAAHPYRGLLPPPPLLLPQVVVQALLLPDALNKSFDLVSMPEGEGEPTWDWTVLFDQTTAGL